MRRHHNPRYAPEALERKLHPSGMVAIPVTAEVSIQNAPQTIPAASALVFIAGQAALSSVDSSSTDSPDEAPTGVSLNLDDPAPGGTEPPPPPGDGTPPISDPTLPGGPVEPA